MSRQIEQDRTTTLQRDAARVTDGQLLECFIEREDESAFKALVELHGPMVFGVCRRVLGNHHDAEEAFQATFLVLTRKAAVISTRETVANWLYGVAHRAALKAKGARARRQVRERQVTQMPEPHAPEQNRWLELEPLLDQELSCLAEKYRTPMVLCHLEGKTHKEAARLLGWTEGTITMRLKRARKMLAKRLAQRGLALSTAILGGLVSRNGASAAVPGRLIVSTVKAASLSARSQTVAAGTISPSVTALTEGVLKSMWIARLGKVTSVLLLLTAAILGAATLFHLVRSGGTSPSAQNPDEPTAALESADKQAQEAVAKDLEKLHGSWKLVAAEANGKPIPAEELNMTQYALSISGDHFTLQVVFANHETAVFNGSLRLDPTRQPKSMDWVDIVSSRSALPEGEKRKNGIYDVDAETLKFCTGKKERPNSFKTAPQREAEQMLMIFKRVGAERRAARFRSGHLYSGRVRSEAIQGTF